MTNPLRIVHCLRAPVGGLFRHVLDLAQAQAAAGCKVGIIADSLTGGAGADAKLAALAPALALGVVRVPMPRSLGLLDITAWQATCAFARRLDADVLHGHGAKGGAYARLAARRLKRERPSLRVLYTPHGGSLHYEPHSPQGLIFLGLERQLAQLTDGLIFESAYSRDIYQTKVGTPACPLRVIPNGLKPADFAIVAPAADATDVLFVGELRKLKGVDVLLDALAMTRATATIVGAGPDAQLFRDQASALGLSHRVRFPGAMPAATAFTLGRLLVVPSRAESFPYIVLEGAAAGLAMLASNVGGIPEITGSDAAELVPPGDARHLATHLVAFAANPEFFRIRAKALRARVHTQFTVARMAGSVMDFYDDVRRQPALKGAQAQILSTG